MIVMKEIIKMILSNLMILISY